MKILIKKYIKNNFDIKTILDYGGNRGQLVSYLLPKTQSFVYEISNPKPEDSVTLIDNLNCSAVSKFDLVFLFLVN